MMDPEGVGRRGWATVLRGEEREPETTEDEGVGRSGCATVRSVAVCMTKGVKACGGISAAGSSEMWFEISCAIVEVGRNEGMWEVRLFSGSGG